MWQVGFFYIRGGRFVTFSFVALLSCFYFSYVIFNVIYKQLQVIHCFNCVMQISCLTSKCLKMIEELLWTFTLIKTPGSMILLYMNMQIRAHPHIPLPSLAWTLAILFTSKFFALKILFYAFHLWLLLFFSLSNYFDDFFCLYLSPFLSVLIFEKIFFDFFQSFLSSLVFSLCCFSLSHLYLNYI